LVARPEREARKGTIEIDELPLRFHSPDLADGRALSRRRRTLCRTSRARDRCPS
jgi:hypothetical protein